LSITNDRGLVRNGSIIPVALLDLTGLTFLSLYGDQFGGTIPSTIGRLRELTYLNLGGNVLTGSVPQEMVHLKQLTFLSLKANPYLNGVLAAFNFSQFTKCCAMAGDPFTCPLPPGAEKCTGGPGVSKLDKCGKRPAPTCFAACNGTSSALTANDCSAWQRFTRDPLYTEWAEGKCGAQVHTDPCSCTFYDRVQCANGRITRLAMYQQSLVGPFPTSLLKLTGLTVL
jgi:hypothetical protein